MKLNTFVNIINVNQIGIINSNPLCINNFINLGALQNKVIVDRKEYKRIYLFKL